MSSVGTFCTSIGNIAADKRADLTTFTQTHLDWLAGAAAASETKIRA
jgi:hypothetical protein